MQECRSFLGCFLPPARLYTPVALIIIQEREIVLGPALTGALAPLDVIFLPGRSDLVYLFGCRF